MIKKSTIYLTAGTGLFLFLIVVLVVGRFLYGDNPVGAPSPGLKADLEKIAVVFLKHKDWKCAQVRDGWLHFYESEALAAMDTEGVRSVKKIKLSEFPHGKEVRRKIMYLTKNGKNVLFTTGGILNNTHGWVYSKDGCIEFRGTGEIYNASAIAGESDWFEFDTICN